MHYLRETLLLGLFFVKIDVLEADKPCAARSFPGNSVVCVCNATYCDTITRSPPPCGRYVVYTSTKGGLRFKKSFRRIEQYTIASSCMTTLNVNPKQRYQELSGFGGAATDAAGINLYSLKHPAAQKHLINSYFSENGIGYSMIRVPMGGTDFSTRKYAYNDQPVNDKHLKNFTLSFEDYRYKVPFIQAAMSVATEDLRLLASLWSPPRWMKDSNSFTKGFLKKEFYQTLADYFLKFLEHYKRCKIPIWGITTTNEPVNNIMVKTELNKLQWNVYEMGEWIQNNLGPTLWNSEFKHVKIIVGDDQRNMIPFWFNLLVDQFPGALKYISGVGVHFYLDHLTPPDQLTEPMKDYPAKFLLYTEACEGTKAPKDKRVDLGNWSRAEHYASNIIEVLNHKVIGWIDWNMCLNETGGPSWMDEGVDSPIIVSSCRQEFYKQPMFYALGHFSKFLPRGSRRVHVQVEYSRCQVLLQNVAFLTPEKTIVIIVLNKGRRRNLLVNLGTDSAAMCLEAQSITTMEFPYRSCNSTC